MGFKPTQEQLDAIEKARTGQDLKILAFAGAAKTTTLELIAKDLFFKKVLYLAFNKSIATEASNRFSFNVTCKTTHSLAYSAIVGQTPAFKDKLKGRLTGFNVAKMLGLRSMSECTPLTPSQYGSMVLKTVTNFCNSGYPEFHKKLVPLNEMYDLAVKRKGEITPDLMRKVYADAQRLWKKMIDPNDTTYITHDTYLKLHELTRPPLSQYDIIMLDESQDSNDVVLSIVGHAKAQKIFVGDPYQQIYSWRGSVNAMDEIHTPHIAYLSQSFRFGDQVAALADHILEYELECDMPIRGFESVADTVCELAFPDCMIFRTNAGVIGEAMSQIQRGRKVCIIGDIEALIRLIDGVNELQQTNRSSHPELMDFLSYQDFVEYTESPFGKDLAVIVKLLEEKGYKALKQALETIRHNTEQDSDIILTTAHKSKGREFETVKLGGDFKAIEDLSEKRNAGLPVPDINKEEFNLLYVAVTRAKKAIDVSSLRYFDELLEVEDVA